MRLLAPIPILGLVIAAAIGWGGTGAGAAAPSPRANGVGAPIDWTTCEPRVTGVECATIRVPLDWDTPGGRTIRLALARHLASKPSEKIGTLFINPGGPGDTGVGLIKGDPTGIDAFGDGRFDVVSWDPRGTHASSRVKCFRSGGAEARFWAGVSIPTSNAASKKFVPTVKRWARGCGKVSGWLLPHITTADTARDLNHLRVLSGEAKLTYIGLSYGSMLGQTSANMYPGTVRAMLLEGIVDAQSYTRNAEDRIAA
ncbi:MAG: alpha/beta fold hydrolase, partial [Solirubrobacterales bacterium]